MNRTLKTSTLSSLSLLLLAAPLAGFAQDLNRQLKPNEVATNQPGVTSFVAPPKGFDPLAASDQDLAEFGFPPRPNASSAPKAFATWAKAMTASKLRLAPTVELTNVFHGPAKMKTAVADKVSNTFTSSNWSGYLNTSGASNYSSSSFYYVLAEYVVPVANQAFGKCTGGWDYSSSWVGIDGAYSTDVLQAGTESDAYCNGSTRTTYYSPWFEWYPYSESRISNLPIAPGDDYFVEVWSTTSTTGHAYLVNENTDQYVDLTFYAPSGTTLRGNSAEWIVERPTVGSLSTLSNYIADPMWDAEAFLFTGTEAYPGNSNAVDMYDYSVSPASLISFPTLLNATSFLMQDTGTAY